MERTARCVFFRLSTPDKLLFVAVARYTVRMTSPFSSDLFSAIVPAPFGAIGVCTVAALVHELVYLPPQYGAKVAENATAGLAAAQLENYLRDPDFIFDLPLELAGTAFQQRVWKAIAAIPRGSVLTYGQVAKLVGTAPRAVGQACGANWFPVVIPCHRVTATGGLGGFSHHDDEHGFHLGVKRWLLAHEGASTSPWQQQTIFS